MRKKTAISELLDVLEILKSEGVNITKLNAFKRENGKQTALLLNEIKQDGINIQEIIEAHKLNPDYKIGARLNGLKQAIIGKGTYYLSDKEKKKAIELGFKGKSEKEYFIFVLDCLKKEGIDVRKIQKSKIVNGKPVSTTLKDIKFNGDIDRIIQKYGLDENYEIGSKIKGKNKKYFSKKAVKQGNAYNAQEIGIPAPISSAKYLLEVLDILAKAGVDVTKIQLTKTVRRYHQSTTIGDINQKGVNIEDIIKANNLNRDYTIGYSISKFRQSYRGGMGISVAEEDKRHAERLGIIPVKDMEYEQLRLQSRLNKAKELEKDVVGEKDENAQVH